MKIKITTAPKVAKEVQPKASAVYEVRETRKTPGGRKLYMIHVADVMGKSVTVGVLEHECEVVEE